MSRPRVLVTAPYMLPELDRFRSELEALGLDVVTTAVAERLEEDALLPLVADVDAAICGDDRFSERVLASAPRLKVISKWGTGIDSIDQEACRRRGIQVCNTPNAFSIPVADSVLGYALAFARRIPWMDREMKAGRWAKLPSRSLSECSFGIVGVGNVGKAVARLVSAFGARLMGTDPQPPPREFVQASGISMVPLAQLLAESDFVSVNCDLNPTSFHLFDRANLAAMRRGAVLINTARGPIVDEAALVDALASGQLGGAALDVYEREPLPLDSPLLGFDNVLLAPHNSNSSPTAWERVHRSTIRNLARALGLDAP